MLTTPQLINSDVYRLREKIGVTTEPVFVPVQDTNGNTVAECFPNVNRKVAKCGGSLCHGWIVWEWPGKLIEAEFHGVWAAPNGTLSDITPKADGESQILFIP